MKIPTYGGPKHTRYVKEALERFTASEKAKRPHESRYRRALMHYEMNLRRTKDWRYPTFIIDPRFLSLVDTNVAREMAAIFGSTPILRQKARGDTDHQLAQDWTDLISFYMDRMRPRREVEGMLKTRRMAGNCFVGFSWRRWIERKMRPVTRTVQVELPFETGDPLERMYQVIDLQGVTEMEVQEVEEGQPWMHHIPYHEAFPDADFATIQEGEYFIHRRLREKRYLQEKAKLGEWHKGAVARALDSGTQFPLDAIGATVDWRSRDGEQNEVLMRNIEDREWFEVWEVWRANCRYVTINREFIVRYDDSPSPTGKIPIYTGKRVALPGRLYAMSDFQVIETCLRNYQDMRNAGATEALLSVFGLVTAMPGAQIAKLVHEPGAVIPVKDHDEFRFVQRPNYGQQIAAQQMGLEASAMDDALHLNDAVRGVEPNTNAKATNVSLAVHGAGVTMQSDVSGLGEEIFQPWGDEFRELARVYETEDRIVQATEDTGAPARMLIMDELRAAELDTVTEMATSENVELDKKRRQEALEVLGDTRRFPFVDLRELVKSWAVRAIPERASLIVRTDEQMLEEQIRQMEMQATLQQRQAQILPPPPPAPPMPPGGPTGPGELAAVAPGDGGMGEMAAELGSVVRQ